MSATLFHSQLQHLYDQAQTQETLISKAKARAWDHFLEIGLPDTRQESYQYIPLNTLFSKTYKNQPSVPSKPISQESCLVFINGIYQPDLSRGIPKKLVCVSLSEALKTYGSFLNNHWARSLQEETDAFATLNSAMHIEGLFIYLPPKTVLEKPIHILNFVNHAEDSFLTPRTHIFAGAHSQATFLSTLSIESSSNYCLNQATELILDEGAHIRFLQDSSKHSPESWHFDALRAYLKRDSQLKTVHFTRGSAATRHDYRISLAGENAEASLNGLWMLSGKKQAHTHVLVDHQAPHCRSMQLFKGVLRDFSRSSFEGKIFVKQAAQKTDAFQLNNNLLLNERAIAYSKPNLEIFADDVKASHGATVGQLDQDQLFYLKARGIPQDIAKNILVSSFCKEVIDQMPELECDIHVP